MKAKNILIIPIITSSIARAMEILKTKDDVNLHIEPIFDFKESFAGPFASIRDDEGFKNHIGNDSNIQDDVVTHRMKNVEYGSIIAMKQEGADRLLTITEGYRYFHMNEKIVNTTRELALGYHGDNK
ncbi:MULTISPECIES: hypothetical protein [unclassified Bacillus (in: firmicutes)]|uniref:hypothetical protein n=1 Tax=unclassified Bacillus (in: firmicutes) TaxID=185979 RepID=UPI000D02888C|nr:MULTISPECIES: hypothetical protein [unclassified Bacillus (in: firmicutes)]PRR92643.1 hypothetical protein C6W21_04375 [Bacillus sp. NMCN1]PRS00275.1 hypothetical protein C6W20_04415 [Bacillus sp. NMCN6]